MNRNLLFIISVFFCLCLHSKSFSQTQVTGTIFGEEVWTKDKSPYVISGTFGVYPGGKLIIEKGVKVKVAWQTSITIKGSIIVNGTKEEPVTFRALSGDTVRQSWFGITITNGIEDIASFKHASFFYGDFPLNIRNSKGKIIITNCSFGTNYYSIYAGGSKIIVDSCLFLKSYDNSIYGGLGTITNSTFINTGINFGGIIENCKLINGGVGAGSTTIVKNCIFDGGGVSVYHKEATITNCIIRNSNAAILVKENITSANIKNNKICDNKINVMLGFGQTSNFNISGNCFCTTDTVELRKKMWDAQNDVNLGIISFLPLQDCDVISNPEDTTYKISGLVNAGFNILSTGIVLLYSDKVNYPISYSTVENGAFTFKKVPRGKYKLYAIPDTSNKDYLPTYYVNKIHEKDAYVLEVNAHVFDIDIKLAKLEKVVTSTERYKGNISYLSSMHDSTFYTKEWFSNPTASFSTEGFSPKNLTVFLHNPSGSIINWTLTDEKGNFTFPNPSEACYISVERKGYALSGNAHLYKASEFFIGSSQILGIEENQSIAKNQETLNFYPNPVENLLNVDLTNITNGNVVYEIISAQGEILIKEEISKLSKLTIDLSSLKQGIYFFRIANQDKHQSFLFQKN